MQNKTCMGCSRKVEKNEIFFSPYLTEEYANEWSGDAKKTIDLELSEPKGMARPCFMLSSENTSGQIKTGSWRDLGPLSQGGEMIYFFDMTSQYDAKDVEAHFGGNGSDITVEYDSTAGGFKIPMDTSNGAYSTVAFYAKETNAKIGATYNFFNSPEQAQNEEGFLYDSIETNTFYYGATEYKNGKKVSKWGARPSENSTSLAGKKLYFDSIYFNTAEKDYAKFRIGDEEPVVLEMDADGTSEFSYSFASGSTADSHTILTYMSKDEEVKYHFFWNTMDAETIDFDEVTVEYEIADVGYVHKTGNEVYFDATMSKMTYQNTDGLHVQGESVSAGHGIPYVPYVYGKGLVDEHKVYFYATGEGVEPKRGLMTYVEPKEGWKDVYKVSLEPEYTKIRFAGYEFTDENAEEDAWHGDGTGMLDIPRRTLRNPCFYADNGDNVVYYGGNRGGYWGEVYTIRDAEAGKKTVVVDVASSTLEWQNDYYFVNSTMYDYYSDFELNGYNRDDYVGSDSDGHRKWVTFRQFDQALSDYYREKELYMPLYTGHFCPDPTNYQFDGLRGIMNLWGFDDGETRPGFWFWYNGFYAVNQSTYDTNGAIGRFNLIAQGLVGSQLVNGELMAKKDANNASNYPLPYFNEDFLTGNNSKNAVLGKIYEDVAIPFKSIDRDNNGIKYWHFDSAETTVAMRQDSGKYYLEMIDGDPDWSKNIGDAGGNKGFFPFNEGAGGTNYNTYNYGFGARLEIKFRLTESGTVLDNNNQEVPITFEFSGDDDVWVFIDDQLALDIGGDHGIATGKINFGGTSPTKTVETSETKESPGGSTPNTFTMQGSNTDEHTLIMYYMERGTWESNMKIDFNFPDENQLIVKKKVDDSAVNKELFGGLFDNISFPFYIRNQATHFESQEANGAATTQTLIYTDAFAKTGKTADPNTFEQVANFQGHDNVVLWNAVSDDVNPSKWQDRRLGLIYTDNGGRVNVSNPYEYLQFHYYYNADDLPTLSHMYLEFRSANGNVRAYLSDKIANGESMVLRSKTWSRIVVDLSKFEGVDWSTLECIGFGYDYSRDIYLDTFVFKSETVAPETTGFITKQWDIPDYGSVKRGDLVYPAGAVYSLTSKGVSTWNVIDDSGKFSLGDEDYVTFRDQFRRGSYIELMEYADSDVFRTTWTMYDDGREVNRMEDGDTIDLESPVPDMTNVSRADNAVYDGRTEYYSTDAVENHALNNGGYTYAHRPISPTFVFRTYSLPDYDNGLTKLMVVYKNSVNTGSLTIRKAADEGSEELNGTYKFLITFTNVAGIGLEGSKVITKEITLTNGQSQTITGIPVKTEFTIVETAEDGSFLSKVTETGNKEFTFDSDTKLVSGQISGGAGSNYNFMFFNMKKETIDIQLEKKWVDAAGTPIIEEDPINCPTLPESLTICLERRAQGGEWEDVPHEDQANWEYALGTGYDRLWSYKFTNLDKYVENDRSRGEWEYRIVELGKDGKIIPDNGFWDTYQASYQKPELQGTNAAHTVDNYEASITNIHTVSLKIMKKDGAGNPLEGVSFQLQQKVGEEWKTVVLEGGVDNTLTTKADGICTFYNLPKGEYQLIETKTAQNHNLMANPINIKVRLDGEYTYTINGKDVCPENNIIKLTIKNGQNLVMPATGGAGPIPFIVGGLSICMIASLMYIDSMRKRRKEGKSS